LHKWSYKKPFICCLQLLKHAIPVKVALRLAEDAGRRRRAEGSKMNKGGSMDFCGG